MSVTDKDLLLCWMRNNGLETYSKMEDNIRAIERKINSIQSNINSEKKRIQDLISIKSRLNRLEV